MPTVNPKMKFDDILLIQTELSFDNLYIFQEKLIQCNIFTISNAAKHSESHFLADF
jgi:hypothetical protein